MTGATGDTGTTDSLVRMVNQIGANLAYLGEAEAQPALAAHLTSFWAPEMRTELLAYVDAGGSGLSPVASAAIALLRVPALPSG